jgi:hypothetical protein
MNKPSSFTRIFISVCLALLIFSVSVFVLYGGYTLFQSFADNSNKEQTASLPTPSEQNPTSPPAQSTPSNTQIDEQTDMKQQKGNLSKENKKNSKAGTDPVASSAPTKPWKETVKIQNDEIMDEGNTYYLKKGQKIIMKIYSDPVDRAKHRINATLQGPGNLPHHLSQYGVTKQFIDVIPMDGMYTLVLECNYQKNADCSGKATFWVMKEDKE